MHKSSVIKYILLLIISAIIVFCIGFTSFRAFESSLHRAKRDKIKNLAEIVALNITQILRPTENGDVNPGQINTKILNLINDLKCDDKNFFWVSDTELTSFIIPNYITESNINLANLKDKSGKSIFIEAKHTLKTQDQDFFHALWPGKENNLNRHIIKMVLIKKVPNSNLLIGAGAELNDINSALNSFLLKFSIGSVVLILVQSIFVYLYFAQSNQEKREIPINKILLLKNSLNELASYFTNLKDDSEFAQKMLLESDIMYSLNELQQQIRLIAVNFSLEINKSKFNERSITAVYQQLNEVSSYIEQVIKSLRSDLKTQLNTSIYKDTELLIAKLLRIVDE